MRCSWVCGLCCGRSQMDVPYHCHPELLLLSRVAQAGGLPATLHGSCITALLLQCMPCLLQIYCAAAAPAGTQVPETDSVLATTELQELLEQHQVDLHSLEPSPFDSILPAASSSCSAAAGGRTAAAGGSSGGWHANGSSGAAAAAGAAVAAAAPAAPSSSGSIEAGTVPAGSGSGGYLEHVFRAAAAQLFGRQLPPGPLQMRVGRNAGVPRLCIGLYAVGCIAECAWEATC